MEPLRDCHGNSSSLHPLKCYSESFSEVEQSQLNRESRLESTLNLGVGNWRLHWVLQEGVWHPTLQSREKDSDSAEAGEDKIAARISAVAIRITLFSIRQVV